MAPIRVSEKLPNMLAFNSESEHGASDFRCLSALCKDVSNYIPSKVSYGEETFMFFQD